MKKKLMALLLAVALVFTSVTGSGVGAWAATALTEDNITGAILAIKGKFGIGDEFSNFDKPGFYENSSGAVWSFYWSTEDGSKSIYATCDGVGHVLNYEKYGDYVSKSIPKYTSDELLDVAKTQIAKIDSEIAKHMEYKNVYCRSYGACYVYNFVRLENGIEMPDNSVSIAIDYNTKEVKEYSAEWLYDVKIPGATGLITKKDAAAKAGKKVEMKLSYFITYDEEGKAKAFLAYEPDRDYIAVDANSGKIYEERTYWGNSAVNGMADNAPMEEEKSSSEAPSLSEAEIREIEGLKGVISSEEAVNKIKQNKYLFVDKNINYVNRARLFANGDGQYYWSITMSDNRARDWESNDTYRAYAEAQVDACTGEILSYWASLKSYYDFSQEEMTAVKANYTKSQCKKTAESFLKNTIPDRFADTVLGSNNSEVHPISYDNSTGKFTYAGFDFDYDRVNEKIPVNGNHIYISVDAVSGKIFNYSCYWTENVEFPSSKGVIDAKTAFDKYIAYDGFDLVYEIVTSYVEGKSYYGNDVKKSVRLVYRTAISPTYVDAFTGKQLNYDGTEYSFVSRDFNYKDIAGSKYERTIKILASMGAGFDGDEFKPDQVITRDEFQQLAKEMSQYIGYSSYEIKGDKALTRQMAAKAVIGYIGYDELAKLDIYKTGYSDEKKISKGYVGSVALAKGFGIMEAASGKKFKPTAKVTRGEAAQILLNATAVR